MLGAPHATVNLFDTECHARLVLPAPLRARLDPRLRARARGRSRRRARLLRDLRPPLPRSRPVDRRADRRDGDLPVRRAHAVRRQRAPAAGARGPLGGRARRPALPVPPASGRQVPRRAPGDRGRRARQLPASARSRDDRGARLAVAPHRGRPGLRRAQGGGRARDPAARRHGRGDRADRAPGGVPQVPGDGGGGGRPRPHAAGLRAAPGGQRAVEVRALAARRFPDLREKPGLLGRRAPGGHLRGADPPRAASCRRYGAAAA